MLLLVIQNGDSRYVVQYHCKFSWKITKISKKILQKMCLLKSFDEGMFRNTLCLVEVIEEMSRL